MHLKVNFTLSWDLKKQALSSPSPSVMLQSASISKRGAVIHVWYPNFYSWYLVFVAAAQGIPPDCLALEARGGLCPRVPQDCNNRRNSSWQATTPRALHKQHTETFPKSSYEKGLFSCPGASAWGAGYRLITHPEATGVPPREQRQGDTILAFFLGLTTVHCYLPERLLKHISKAKIFVMGDTSIYLLA